MALTAVLSVVGIEARVSPTAAVAVGAMVDSLAQWFLIVSKSVELV